MGLKDEVDVAMKSAAEVVSGGSHSVKWPRRICLGTFLVDDDEVCKFQRHIVNAAKDNSSMVLL